MQREGYWNYMSRRRREDEEHQVVLDELRKRDMAEMQRQVHNLQLRIVELHDQVVNLEYKITMMGGDVKQMELIL